MRTGLGPNMLKTGKQQGIFWKMVGFFKAHPECLRNFRGIWPNSLFCQNRELWFRNQAAIRDILRSNSEFSRIARETVS
jgi:hypothetical protein